MRGLTSAVAVAVLCVTATTGCTTGQLQTARTTADGQVRMTVGQGYVHNEMVAERGVSLGNLPPQIMLRVGVHERVDVGVRMLLGDGLQVDAKVNLMDPAHRLAVSASLGIGAGGWVQSGSDQVSVRMPIHFIVSYDVGDLANAFTPYFGIGYHFWWHIGHDVPTSGPIGPDTKLAAREGHGDGILALNVGAEFKVNPRLSFLVEYAAWLAVVDDPGDQFAMVDSHMALVGLRF